MDSEKGLFIADTLRKLNLKLHAVKEASTKLLPYTSDENMDLFIKIWEQCFHEKRNSERERVGLFFVVHELLYRSNNKKFQEAIYDVLLSCIIQVTNSEHEKLKQEITKLIKLWTDHKIYDTQKIVRLTVQLNLEDQSKDEMILSQLPENLPNPPNELISFAQNLKELQKFKEKVKENEHRLSQLYDTVKAQVEGNSSDQSISAETIHEEISSNMNQLKRNLELENKYRAFTLKSYRDVLIILDKQHMKTVIELKLFLQKISKIESLRNNIELP